MRRHALTNDEADSSRVQVLIDPSGKVAGYYALTMSQVVRNDLPAREVENLPGYPVSAVRLAKLAVRKDLQGHQGPPPSFGQYLLAASIRSAIRASEDVAARVLVVDALNDRAAGFYRRNGFIDLAEHRTLYLNLRRAKASLTASES